MSCVTLIRIWGEVASISRRHCGCCLRHLHHLLGPDASKAAPPPTVPSDVMAADAEWCTMRCMQRTNVYLTAEQAEFLDARAAVVGTTRSAVLRDIIDEAAAQPIMLDAEIRVALDELADGYTAVSKRLFDGDPLLSIDPVDAASG